MNRLIVLFLVLAATELHAVTDYEREFGKLSKERDTAIAAAVDPINQRYRTALEALLRRATAGNDLDTAMQVRKALESVGVSSPFNILFHDRLGTKMTYFDIEANYSIDLICEANGEFHRGDPNRGKWAITGNKLELTSLEKAKPYKTVFDGSTLKNGVVEGRILDGEWAGRKVRLTIPTP